ncbi:uncharacterized protein LOC127081616 [Lathyrus oleraceus]|uniref:uncharacterized protein LOC127081616 n=1 Tax=Pisum sativum TaxID=3888 RepID=UPI0021D2C29F|nr:uncharacterized protein LOC127081616 [Pisum sativum]
MFCEENGIELEVTAPYTPQHNVLTERRNETLLDMTRSMLKEKKLLHTLWGEVVTTAAYGLNRCPTKKLKEIVPLEKRTGDKQRDSEFEDELESEGDSDAEEESNSKGESDSDLDFDDDPDSSGNHASDSGHASEGGPYSEGSPTSDIVPISEEDFEQVQRP